MRFYFRCALAYTTFAFLVVLVRYGDGAQLIVAAASSHMAQAIGYTLRWLAPCVVVIFLLLGRTAFRARLPELFYAVAGALVLQLGFSFLKASIPNLVPFYADPALADLDRWLAGGRDAWEWAYAIAPQIHATSLLPIYLFFWSSLAIIMPSIVALSDDDPARVRRFILLRLFVWIFIGNGLATLFSSVGPVFYDALYGGDRFVPLLVAMEAAGVSETKIGVIQHYLWSGYQNNQLQLGSGISAFPSVHVGIAAATANYLVERHRFFLIPGAAFVAIIFYLSIYTGYHYAVDGVASLVLVLAAAHYLRRRYRADLEGAARPSGI